jgi:hypothetical protein
MTAPRVVESPSESMESLAPDGENKDAF